MVDGAVLWVGLLGPLEARWDGVPLVFPTRKSQALLAYLAARGRPILREDLAELLWGAGRLRNLRQEVYVLRQLPGATHWLSADGDRIAVLAETDLAAAVAARERGEASLAVAVRGAFLEGLQVRAPLAFEEWLEAQRAEWAEQVTQASEEGERRLAQLLALLGEAVAPPEVLAAVLGVEPLVVTGWLDALPLAGGVLRAPARARELARMAPQTRQILAASLAEALASAAAPAPVVADLWEQADQPALAAEAWAQAAQQDLALWPRAHQQATAPAQRRQILLRWIAAARGLGAHAALEQAQMALDALAVQTQQPALLLEAATQRFLSLIVWRRLDEAAPVAEEIRALAERHGSADERSRAWLYLAELRRLTGAPVEAAALYRAAATEPEASSENRIMALNGAGAVAAAQGRCEEALHLHEEALALARATGNRSLAAQLLNSVGADASRLAQYNLAARRFQEAATLALVNGDRATWALTRRNAAVALLHAGLLGEARQELIALLGEEQALPERTRAMIWELRGEQERACGRLDEAVGWASRARAAYQNLDDHHRAELVTLTLHSLALESSPAAPADAFLAQIDTLLDGNDRYLAATFLLEMAVRSASLEVAQAALRRYPAASPLSPHHAFLQHLAALRQSPLTPPEALLAALRSVGSGGAPYLEASLALALLAHHVPAWSAALEDCLAQQTAGLLPVQRDALRARLRRYVEPPSRTEDGQGLPG